MTPLEAPHTRGAHFVLCRVDKHPLWREWQKKQPGFEAVKRHAAAGGLVGLVPASLGCVVVDVDEGGAAGVEALRGVLGEPIATAGTRGGGFHLWYPAPAGKIGNRKWGLDAPPCGGDIRGSNGFVVLWDPSALVDGLAANFAAAPPPSLHALPKPTVNGRGPGAVRAAKPGGRNDTLNRETFLAAARGELDEDVFRDTAAAAGLAPGEVEATLGSAARAGAEKAPEVVPSPSSPMAVARALAAALFTNADGALPLRHHRGGFYRWDGRHWPTILDRDVRGTAYVWLEHAQYDHPRDGLRLFNPTRRKIDDMIDALKAVIMLDSAAEAPCWIDGTAAPPAGEVVSMRNGLLHVPTRTLGPHTPGFFNHHSLPFPYQPECGPPVRWIAFLDELWGDDQPSIDALQETMGYLLGGDTSQQKMFLLVGPKRAGKGTIGRVLTGLLGAHNVAAPTLASLSTNFGLSPLIGKPLALISDARLSGRSDSSVVVERLLSISGEDSLTIDRKYLEPWTGRLPTRLVLLTNELPRLGDASGALVSRFIVFVLTRSFYGRENTQLTDELLSEAPGIFDWALDGLDRLNERGHFVSPESGSNAIQQLEDLSSPVAAFLHDACIMGSEHRVAVDRLWAVWTAWCENEGRAPGSKPVFGRDLHAAAPTIKKTRPHDDSGRTHVYNGIGLKADVGGTT